jgi:hypothetical protein
MYFYKVWEWDFIEHARSPHSILRQFLDRGFSGWRVENWASVVPWPTNSTQSSVIYKLTSGLADYFNFKGLCDKHCAGHVAKMKEMTVSLCLSRKKVVNTILRHLYKKIIKRVTYCWKFKETHTHTHTYKWNLISEIWVSDLCHSPFWKWKI